MKEIKDIKVSDIDLISFKPILFYDDNLIHEGYFIRLKNSSIVKVLNPNLFIESKVV